MLLNKWIPPAVMLITVLGAFATNADQSQGDNWKECKGADPDLSVVACSAIIDSGQETGLNLAQAYRYRGSAYWAKKNYDGAIQDFGQETRLNPNSWAGFYELGRAYAHKGDYSRAIQDYDQALRLNPNFADALIMRGLAQTQNGNYDLGIQDYDKGLRLNPNSADGFYNRALAYLHEGNYDRAVQDYDESLRLKP